MRGEALKRGISACRAQPCMMAASGLALAKLRKCSWSTRSINTASLRTFRLEPTHISRNFLVANRVSSFTRESATVNAERKWKLALPALDSAHPRWQHWFALRYRRYGRVQRQPSTSHLWKRLRDRDADIGSSGLYLAILKSQRGNIIGSIVTFSLITTAWLAGRRGVTGSLDWAALCGRQWRSGRRYHARCPASQ